MIRTEGYSCQFLEPTPDALICLICTFVARDPQQAICCGRVFCRGCLEALQERHRNRCPQCRRHITSFPDTRSDRDIKSLKVLCENTTKGCDWIGELRSLDEHLTMCSFTLLPCPNCCRTDDGEVFLVQLKDVENHKTEECPRRQYECPYCKESGEYKERTTAHLKECPRVEVLCPNENCGETVPRCELTVHIQDCPFNIVPCKYVCIGCDKKILQRDRAEHESDNQQHLQIAIDKLNEITCLQSVTQPQACYKFTNFYRHKGCNDVFFSPPFYTSPGGYKLRLRVDANGNGGGRGVCVSLYAQLMRGENDDHLPWPFTWKLNVELLNQLKDDNHHSKMIIFPSDYVGSQRVLNREEALSVVGLPCYISHSRLGYDAANNCQYLKNDCLFLRVKAEAPNSPKPWLANADTF